MDSPRKQPGDTTGVSAPNKGMNPEKRERKSGNRRSNTRRQAKEVPKMMMKAKSSVSRKMKSAQRDGNGEREIF